MIYHVQVTFTIVVKHNTYVGSSEMAVSSSSMACLNQGGFASTGRFSDKRANDET